MKYFRNFLIFFFIFIILFFVFLFKNKLYNKQLFLFDTVIEIKFFTRNFISAKNVMDEIEKEFKNIDSICSPLFENDIKNKIVAEIVSNSIDVSLKTDGAFDVTIGVISKMWKRFKEPVLPDSNEIIKCLKFVDFKRIQILQDSISMEKGQIIDIGGIAKGYAIKKGIEIMKEHNIKSGMINAGGDIGILGDKNGNMWKIGIRDPFNRNGLIDTLLLKDISIATSGDYERFFEINGKIYHHILNPKTGYPVYNFRSVTVICEDPVYADAYATAIFVLGDKGVEFAKNNNLKVIIVKNNREVIRINI